MASFHQHVTVSTVLGIGYGTAAYFALGVDWATCVLAGGLTGLAGMLPDLDSPSGHPVREVLGFAAAVVPLLVLNRLHMGIGAVESVAGEAVQLTYEQIVVVMAGCYFAVRFGGAWLLGKLAVHRGMFHSIPAALITALAAFLLFETTSVVTRLFLACGSLIGFLSHLLMDELWSVKLKGGDVGLKKSAGTAFKLFSGSIPATLAAYSLLLGLSYMALNDPTLGQRVPQAPGANEVRQIASDLIETIRK